MNEQIIVLIPAYKPPQGLVSLCQALRDEQLDVWVVDDGSGEPYLPIFETVERMGCVVLRHAVNLGKGRALKTGINAIINLGEAKGVVTADADGQHTCKDIGRIAEAMREKPSALVIGTRKLSKEAPWKSRFGNALTRHVYRFVTGISCHDTQTGLRGIPSGALKDMLNISGERYEYEMNMLLELHGMRLSLHEVEIETIYIENNKNSHFNPLRDAIRIYGVIFRFMLSSLLSFCVDYTLYYFFLRITQFAPALSYATARVLSSLLNYTVNRRVIFGRQSGKASVFRYYLIAVLLLLMGSGLVELLHSMTGIQAAWVKIPVDSVLFFVSFWLQREFVFK